MRLPIGYTEKRGNCVIQKVRDYGYKYHVFVRGIRKQFATIKLARAFAIEDFQRNHTI